MKGHASDGRRKGPRQGGQGRRPDSPRRDARAERGELLYGLHAVAAALRNPRRRLRRLYLSAQGEDALRAALDLSDALSRVPVTRLDSAGFANVLGEDAVHQGAALDTQPLSPPSLEESCLDIDKSHALVMLLDQVSDPRNVGAILRSAAAFGAAALVMTDRHAPPITGALAKAASGALETAPLVRVANLSRALELLGRAGYWRIGLASDGAETLAKALSPGPIALVMGAEGSGLRRLTREHCDVIARLPISSAVESLNVSAAAAIALYECRRSAFEPNV